jgi:competence protein ComEA helix-hairpin-helix repeat region
MKIELGKEIIAILIIVIIFLGGLAGYLIVKGNNDIIFDSKNSNAGTMISATPGYSPVPSGSDISKGNGNSSPETGIDDNKEEIKIYVTGCVKNPGIVTILKGQLIDDAIKLAGGVTKDADMSNINLVYKLEDNTMLYIKSAKETTQAVQGTSNEGGAGKGVKLVIDSGGAVVNEGQKSSKSNGKIDINKASLDELDTLPGIGEATAQDIISYREDNGPFKTIQDIMKVPRIKESRFEKIKDFITVDG